MENNNLNTQNNYYNKKSHKVIDYVVGFLITIVFACLIILILFFSNFRYPLDIFSGPIVALILLLIFIFIAVGFSRAQRRYIAKGIKIALLIIVLLPVLAFGACLITLSGFCR